MRSSQALKRTRTINACAQHFSPLISSYSKPINPKHNYGTFLVIIHMILMIVILQVWRNNLQIVIILLVNGFIMLHLEYVFFNTYCSSRWNPFSCLCTTIITSSIIIYYIYLRTFFSSLIKVFVVSHWVLVAIYRRHKI